MKGVASGLIPRLCCSDLGRGALVGISVHAELVTVNGSCDFGFGIVPISLAL